MDYQITIQVEITARYSDEREALTDAESIATHIREETGHIADDVKVVGVEPVGEAA